MFLKLLIDAGANINTKNLYGRTAFEMAIKYDAKDVVNFFMQNKFVDMENEEEAFNAYKICNTMW